MESVPCQTNPCEAARVSPLEKQAEEWGWLATSRQECTEAQSSDRTAG